ncbi:E3 ubiquitin-protein ligase MYCBP2-like [Pollicipes pollicipes]|uniref:E3 ubiquitin-protein ligase MYCBP2-like n=1 Tax=Pollicipes pollicipes TaxID=41117 RepID=UPI00188585BF|nr:E3 ubiquitin-protein ligase MYCBP2-like [Pollicipes pollicipes]
MVGIGLSTVFELVRSSADSHPDICLRALHALLGILEGQQPEALRLEEPQLMDELYECLQALSCRRHQLQLSAAACSCLLSLVVARGETSAILRAVTAVLTSQTHARSVQLPAILCALQRSVLAVLLGSVHRPHWLTHGLYSVGSGYGGTTRGHVYARSPDVTRGQLVSVQRGLYLLDGDGLTRLDPVDLRRREQVTLPATEPGSRWFSDGASLCSIAPHKDDTFIVHSYHVTATSVAQKSSHTLQLVRKRLQVCGVSTVSRDPSETYDLDSGWEDELASVAAGRDFVLLRTGQGKVLYSGKASSLGLKHAAAGGGGGAERWLELPILRSPTIAQVSMGHEGQHAVLVGEDGAAYFTGTPRRGEDGDVAKARRQPKPQRPKRMVKMEGKVVVEAACNNGSSALVTASGHLYIFGKDSIHSEGTSGLIGELRDVRVTHVALGKAHVVVLSSRGHVYTFGMNNKGQCGRDVVTGRETVRPVPRRCAEPGRRSVEPPAAIDAGTLIDIGLGDMVSALRQNQARALSPVKEDNVRKRRDQSRVKFANAAPTGGGGGGGGGGGDEVMSSDHEREAAKMTLLPPARLQLPTDSPAVQVACGLHHTVILHTDGTAHLFGNNAWGQLGAPPLAPRAAPLRLRCRHGGRFVQAAAGSHHTVLLTDDGQVVTFGAYQRGQLGRSPPGAGPSAAANNLWFASPEPVPGIGAQHGRKATWVGASGDQTFIRINENLVNAETLGVSTIIAGQNFLGVLPTSPRPAAVQDARYEFGSLMIGRSEWFCRGYGGEDQADLATGLAVTLDHAYDSLWTFDPVSLRLTCHNILLAALPDRPLDGLDLVSPELALPVTAAAQVPETQVALNLLSCLEVLTEHRTFVFDFSEPQQTEHQVVRSLSRDDAQMVHRFENYGGGWGYSPHSEEAVRFMCDSDIQLLGYGLYGGRGQYQARIKLYDLGMEGGDHEPEGELLAQSTDVVYECNARQTHQILFGDPVPLQAGRWYLAWARVEGPSSDCGSDGQTMLVGEDQAVFYFKSSKRSNNGTDVNAGQLPQLLYRLVTPETVTSAAPPAVSEPVYPLSARVALTVTPACFEALLSLVEWAWRLAVANCRESAANAEPGPTALADLDRLAFVLTSAGRLLLTYTGQVYPPDGQLGMQETPQLAQCMVDVRKLVRRILTEGTSIVQALPEKGTAAEEVGKRLDQVLDSFHQCFVGCFHAFYPTGRLKWLCLCELLTLRETSRSGQHDLLFSAVLAALCCPLVRLSQLLPVYGDEEFQRSPTEAALSPHPTLSDITRHPVLVDMVTHASQLEKSPSPMWSFREVLEQLLSVLTQPLRVWLGSETAPRSRTAIRLQQNTCELLACLQAELVSQCVTAESELVGLDTHPLHWTPSRFTRVSAARSWNTGNGSPDAIALTVDRPGVLLAGVVLYGGAGQFSYDLDLLEEVASECADEPGDVPLQQRWPVLQTVSGQFGPDQTDLVEVRFSKPVPLKEGARYALRLRNSGGRTSNGDGGQSRVKGPDGTVFSFATCPLSLNGTNQTRGQLPQLLYYSLTPRQPGPGAGGRPGQRARRAALGLLQALTRAAADLAAGARGVGSAAAVRVVARSLLTTRLMPAALAHVACMVPADPRTAVQVMSLIQELLPHVAALNNLALALRQPAPDPADAPPTVSPHCCWVESEHPYPAATIRRQRVHFPKSVLWMSVEFDARCCTVQPEDQLFVQVPAEAEAAGGDGGGGGGADRLVTVVALSGSEGWPRSALLLPGCELVFSLETASDYVRDDRSGSFGFRCLVTGYEPAASDGVQHLEQELAYLGGMCAAALMRRNMPLPAVADDDPRLEPDQVDEVARDTLSAHSALLRGGLALSQQPTVSQALDGVIPFSCHSNERVFLRDLVTARPGTSGARLAGWLQPEPRLEPALTETVCGGDEPRCGWPAAVTVTTRDQHGQLAYTAGLKVEVRAEPISAVEDAAAGSCKMRRISQVDNRSFGGHPVPSLDTPYEVTVKDKMCYQAISLMPAYNTYSFEELRFIAPAVRRPAENMMVRSNGDGTYSASWTPAASGWYGIHVTIDGAALDAVERVQVREPPQGFLPPVASQPARRAPPARRHRRFCAQNSAGLRIRSHPSLQSEQVGAVPVGGHITFVDEVHNDDGVWVRLSPDSMHELCGRRPPAEGWCLQYNQHLGKTLLVPPDEPPPSLDDVINQAIQTQLPENSGGEEAPPDATQLAAGPAQYEVVRCGLSGLDLRLRPSRAARRLAAVQYSCRLASVGEYVDGGDRWVKLSNESVSRFCPDAPEAWALVSDPTLVYLRRVRQPVMNGHCNMSTSLPTATAFNFTTNLSKSFSFVNSGAVLLDGYSPPSGHPLIMGRESPPRGAAGGVSVRDVVKALSESRYNGNGDTPPRTRSRSSSPLAVRPRHGSTQLSSSRADSAQSDTSALLSSLTRDMSVSPAGSSLHSYASALNAKEGGERSAGRKRERTSSPTGLLRDKAPVEAPPRPRQPPKSALSPSVAECQRAVFAAFLWHEGVVHDAMACATYLKFHPGDGRQRHSLEVSGGRYLHGSPTDKPRPAADDDDNRCGLDAGDSSGAGLDTLPELRGGEPGPAPSLQYLAAIWDGLRTISAGLIAQQVALPSPSTPRPRRPDRPRDQRDKRAKKQRSDLDPVSELEQRCDLCLGLFSDLGKHMKQVHRGVVLCELCGAPLEPGALIAHMKEQHRGCGLASDGRAYHVSGVYAETAARPDQCGAACSGLYYQLCVGCRERHMAAAGRPDVCRRKKTKKRAAPVLRSPAECETHRVMRQNAVFLLELAAEDPAARGAAGQRCLHTLGGQQAHLRRLKEDELSMPDTSQTEEADEPSARLQQLRSTLSLSAGQADVQVLMTRPVVAFVLQQHELGCLQRALTRAIRRGACRVYALQALNWLLRSVTQPTCLHDLLWYFIQSLTLEPAAAAGDAPPPPADEEDVTVLEHPQSDVPLAGSTPLPAAFHSLLQTISDLMPLLPGGSSLQLMAVRCWGLRFLPADHGFLHRSHVFTNISSILAGSDEAAGEEGAALSTPQQPAAGADRQACVHVTSLVDVTASAALETSSRPALLDSLTDGSTETFWESGDEDRNRSKAVTAALPALGLRLLAVHVDNVRDLQTKVSAVTFRAGRSADELTRLRSAAVDPHHAGWLAAALPAGLDARHVRLELKGPDNSLRLRQVALLSEGGGPRPAPPAATVRHQACEAETLRVFRLIAAQVFGKLLSHDEGETPSGGGTPHQAPQLDPETEEDTDLRQHMVSILFSRCKLTHLQTQICDHIMAALGREAARLRDETEPPAAPDTHCFQMLSMLLALSGSAVGRQHLSGQRPLVADLLALLHTASARCQRQVVSLLRRVLPEMTPAALAQLQGAGCRLPEPQYGVAGGGGGDGGGDGAEQLEAADDRPGVLDVLFACVAKCLSVQVKYKEGAAKVTRSVRLSEARLAGAGATRWWLRGQMTSSVGERVLKLLHDMSEGKLSEPWSSVTRASVAASLLSLSRLQAVDRAPAVCLQSSTLWLALVSLCVLRPEHAERLTSGHWRPAGGQACAARPTCDNHDDGETAAIILCSDCGNLCADCDRVLHLPRRARPHHRQVFKEEEEAIRVDLHEGCGRLKLFWLMALSDAPSLKSMVEFRSRAEPHPAGALAAAAGQCRFCGAPAAGRGPLDAAGAPVCGEPECAAHARAACQRVHECGHACGGVRDEEPCLPCLHGCSAASLRQDADDMCMICFTDPLSAAPAIQLSCAHLFHLHCCRRVLVSRWLGPRITFGFSLCPICKASIEHTILEDLLAPIRALHEDVRKKALVRCEYEGLKLSEAVTTPGARFYDQLAAFAMDRYAYYVCSKCQKAYYGGEARCDAALAGGDDYDPSELVCGACSDVSRAQLCPKHGTDFLEYKCRYCCSVAVFFCFGKTHFCNACHDDFQRLTSIPVPQLPACPAGPRAVQLEGTECPLQVEHPATGEEFALGCGVCRNAHTF